MSIGFTFKLSTEGGRPSFMLSLMAWKQPCAKSSVLKIDNISQQTTDSFSPYDLIYLLLVCYFWKKHVQYILTLQLKHDSDT